MFFLPLLHLHWPKKVDIIARTGGIQIEANLLELDNAPRANGWRKSRTPLKKSGCGLGLLTPRRKLPEPMMRRPTYFVVPMPEPILSIMYPSILHSLSKLETYSTIRNALLDKTQSPKLTPSKPKHAPRTSQNVHR